MKKEAENLEKLEKVQETLTKSWWFKIKQYNSWFYIGWRKKKIAKKGYESLFQPLKGLRPRALGRTDGAAGASTPSFLVLLNVAGVRTLRFLHLLDNATAKVCVAGVSHMFP